MTLSSESKKNLNLYSQMLGLITFIFLPIWNTLFAVDPQDQSWKGYIYLVLTILLLSYLLIYLNKILYVRLKKIVVFLFVPLLAALLFQSCYIVANGFRSFFITSYVYSLFGNYDIKILDAFIFMATCSFLALYLFRKYIMSLVKNFLLVFVALFFIANVQFIYSKTFQGYPRNIPPVRAMKKSLLVLIFDELGTIELDKNLSQLKSFQMLEKRAAIRGSVFPPSNFTYLSIPSLLTSNPLKDAHVATTDILVMNNGPFSSIRNTRNIFSEFAAREASISIIGWALPYKRTFNAYSAHIFDQNPFRILDYSDIFETLYKSNIIFDRLLNLFDPNPFDNLRGPGSPFYSAFKKRIFEDLESNKFDLIFVHVPIPHLPRIDERQSLGIEKDYSDNLIECDKLLQRIMETLDLKNTVSPWQVIITSDHWLRYPDKFTEINKVPFYFLDSEFKGETIKIMDGSNLAMFNIVELLIKNDRSTPDPKSIREQLLSHGRESVILK